jgi:hypothetical protein
MTLNSSGPISLAGTTAGVSIEVELGGGGTTQISLNDTNVRTLAGVASGAITMPTNFYGKSNVSYFLANITDSSNNQLLNCGHGVYGSNIGVMISISSSSYANVLLRLTTSGTTTSSTNFYSNNTTGYKIVSSSTSQQNIAIDSSGNVWCNTNYSNSGDGMAYINSSNTFVTLKNNPTYGSSLSGSTTDGSYLYVPNNYTSGSCCCTTQTGFYKWNSSGTGIYYTINNNYVSSIVQGPDSNGILWFSNYGGYPAIWTTTTSGSYKYVTVNPNIDGFGFNINSNGSLFGLAGTYTGSTAVFGLYNSSSQTSGTNPSKIVFYKATNGGDGVPDFAYDSSIVFDSSNNSYFLIGCSSSTNYGFFLIKLNSSGTVQWSRRFVITGTASNYQPSYNGYISTASNSIFCSITAPQGVSPTTSVLFINYPTDGSKTGSYVVNGTNVVISSSNISISTQSVGFATTTSSVSAFSSGSVSSTNNTKNSSTNSTTTIAYTTL